MYLRVGIALAAVLAGLVVFQYLVLGAARSVGLVASRESFTELYFSRPTGLPPTIASAAGAHFSFVIDNHEGGVRDYRWAASYGVGGTERPLASGAVRVPDGHSHLIAVNASLPPVVGRTVITVRLVAPRESIDFHVRFLALPRITNPLPRRA